MDDITLQYLNHLVQYEPFQVAFPRMTEALRQSYFRTLLLPPHKRTPQISDDMLRGKVEGLADLETFVQRLRAEHLRALEEQQAPAPQPAAAWVDPEPFARVRTD